MRTYSSIIGAAGGWEIQQHPRMRKFEQYYNCEKNAYLAVYPDGLWKLFEPVLVAGLECFSDTPSKTGSTETDLKTIL